MTTLTSRLIVTLTDGVTGPAKRAATSLRSLTSAAHASARAAARQATSITTAMTAGLGAAGLYKAHEAVMKFATASNKLAAANPDFGAGQIKEVQRLAREVSRQSLFDPGTVMEAANALARADVSLEAIKGSLKPLAVAAMAADVPVSKLSDDFVKLASNFGMSLKTRDEAAKTFAYLGDLAVYVGQKAPGTFTDFVQAMVKVGASAKSAGVDIKFLAGAYIELDKAGIRNEEAGTALRSLIKHLVQPKHEARAMYAQLGIDMSSFLKSGKAVTADQFVAAFQSEYGKSLKKAQPKIQEIMTSNLPFKDRSAALMKIVQSMWGGEMRPVDARKAKKTIDNVLLSATEKIDPEAWLKQMAEKGVTLGQLLRLIEPRQSKLIALINKLKEDLGPDEADKRLNSKLSDLPGFRSGLADEAGGKMMQGYPMAIKKVQDAFQSFIEMLDKAGAIDAFASGLTAVGNAITAITQGAAGFKEWALGLAAAVPVIGAISPLLVGFSTVLAGVGAALLAIVGTPAGIAIALGAIATAVYNWWPEIKKFFSEIDLFDVGAKIGQSLWDGMKWALGKVGDAAKYIYDKVSGGGEKKGEQPAPPTIFKPQAQTTYGWGGPAIDDAAGAARGAGQRTGDAYKQSVETALRSVDQVIDAAVQRWVGKLSFTASPKITPQFAPVPSVGKQSSAGPASHTAFADYGFDPYA